MIITVLRVNSLIATLAMTTVISAVIQWYTKGISILTGIPESLTSLGRDNLLGIPELVYVAVAVALVLGYVLNHTPYGRSLSAVGSNRESARLVGLRVDWLVATTFVVSGAIAGIAGALLVARTGAANPSVVDPFTLPAFTVVFLGATTIRPGRFTICGTLVALVFLAVLQDGLNLAGTADYVQSLVNGIALIVGVAVSALLARRRGA
jgi:ribose transport system permease protein